VVLKVDIEVDGVGGNAIAPQTSGNFQHARGVHVAVAGLLEAQGPKRRQGRRPSQPCVGFDDLFGSGTVEDVVIDWTRGCAEGIRIWRLLAEIEAAAPGVVEQHAESMAGAKGHEVGNAFVERVGGFLIAIGIGVPQSESLVAAIEGSGLIAEAEVMLIERHGLADTEGISFESDRPRVLLQNVSGAIAQGDFQSLLVDVDG